MAYIYSPQIWGTQVGSWKVWVRLEVPSKALSQNKQEIVNQVRTERKSARFEKQAPQNPLTKNMKWKGYAPSHTEMSPLVSLSAAAGVELTNLQWQTVGNV